MPFIRYNRDKRGYESTFVMHAYRSPQGAQQTRVLYFFRSPSNLQVGRRALDEEVVEALEHMHPDLAFDWPALLRERGEARPEPRSTPRRSGPPPGRRPSSGGRQAPPAVKSAEVTVEDQSLLGKVLGAAEAARLRRRFADIRHRIARRARTPEDRDRLSERADRLNPDEWPDEAAVREKSGTFEAELDAIAEELPGRRRGRRGGRGRKPGQQAPGGDSAIMETDGGRHAGENQPPAADRVADAAGDSGGLGSDEPGAGTETATDVP